jgi:hypothetical protein
MARRQLLALIFVSGYIVALVPVLWARYDISRIPRSIWRYTAPRPRELWRGGLLVAYVCAGWPGLVAALLWRFSGDRRALREEWAHLHRRNVESRREPASDAPPPVVLPAAVGGEPEIVLADYEDAETAVRAADVDEPQAATREDVPGASG